MDECRSAEPRTQDQNWNSLGTANSARCGGEAVSFGIDRERKTLLRYCSEEPRSFQSGAPRTWGIARVLFVWEEWQEWVSKFMTAIL